MFDDLKLPTTGGAGGPPVNLPTVDDVPTAEPAPAKARVAVSSSSQEGFREVSGVVDMFAEPTNVTATVVNQPAPAVVAPVRVEAPRLVQPQPMAVIPTHHERPTSKRLFIIAMIVVLAGLVGGGIYAWLLFLQPKPSYTLDTLPDLSGPEAVTPIPNINDPIISTIPESTPQPVAKDQDGDGLSDEEEDKIGTHSLFPDTDFDALTDYEEVKVYGTNPLQKDSDGDGYEDGREVKNNYNPAGPGRLREPEASVK